MPITPVRFKVPKRCKLCGALGTVTPETTITRGSVRLTWCCRSCGNDWPITRGEQLIERHEGKPNPQRVTRHERRGR
jgi:hypothetical protein